MAKWPDNRNKQWTSGQIKELQQQAKENTPTRVIALKQGRTTAAVQNKAAEEGISLKPANQRPYGTGK